MSDSVELLTAAIGGVGVGGLVIKLLTWSTQRNIAHFDQQFERLEASFATFMLKVEETFSEFRKEVQLLRESNISTAEKQGAANKGHELLSNRVDKLAEYWQREFKRGRAGK